MARLTDHLEGPDDELIAFDVPAGASGIAQAEVISGRKLSVGWDDGTVETVDLAGLIHGNRHFRSLENAAAFAAFAVLEGGHGIRWAEGPDLSAEALHTIAAAQRGWNGADFSAWMDRLGLSIQIAADVLELHPATIKRLKAGNRIDRTIMLAATALESDPVTLSAFYRPRRAGRPPKREDLMGYARGAMD